MVAYSKSFSVRNSKIFSQVEINKILNDLKAKKGRQALVKLIIFRLATFCGLRVTEMALLNLEDVRLDCEQPYIRIRAETAKGHKAREIPILSEATISELKGWKTVRIELGASDKDSFLVSVSQDSLGHQFSRQGLRLRFNPPARSWEKSEPRA